MLLIADTSPAVFQELLKNNRYYAKKYLNLFLQKTGEQPI